MWEKARGVAVHHLAVVSCLLTVMVVVLDVSDIHMYGQNESTV